MATNNPPGYRRFDKQFAKKAEEMEKLRNRYKGFSTSSVPCLKPIPAGKKKQRYLSKDGWKVK